MASKDAAKKQWMPGLARHPYIKKGGKDEINAFRMAGAA